MRGPCSGSTTSTVSKFIHPDCLLTDVCFGFMFPRGLDRKYGSSFNVRMAFLTAQRVRVPGEPSAVEWPLLYQNRDQARRQQRDGDQAPHEDGQRNQR